MNDDLLNILSSSNTDIDNQKLMDYLSDKLSAEDKHALEKLMVDSELMNDAVEGLNNFKSKQDIAASVEQLNVHLKKQIEKKKSKKIKRSIKNLPSLYLTIILILVIILVAFIIIKKSIDSEKTSNNIPGKKESAAYQLRRTY